MLERIAVRRYSEAFIDFAKDNIGIDKAAEDFKKLKGAILHDNPDFLKFLRSPGISFSEKCAFIDKVLGEDFSFAIRDFLKLLVEKERIAILTDIAEYIRLNYSHGRRTEALLRVSSPLESGIIKDIEDRLESKFGKKFKFRTELDAGLLGGVQVVIGNTIIDGSIRRRLDELRERLMSARVEA
ncbi:MAG: ATP synthase F1 subunit delta [Candidatus Omnitrophota bacterium]